VIDWQAASTRAIVPAPTVEGYAMHRRTLLTLPTTMLVGGCATTTIDTDLPAVDTAAIARVVADAERAFASTMARRDLDAFASFLSPRVVFINGGKPLRGRDAVIAHWRQFYAQPEAPFAWEPDTVEVTDDGLLAYSTGPVRAPDGRLIARFHSTWALESDGRWRVVFDNGTDACTPGGT
jgi:uncharacterized protein (TIGR02246 family)